MAATIKFLNRSRALVIERYMRLPKLLRFLGEHLAFGAAIGVAFAALILISNVSGIKDLIEESQNPYLAMALLYAMNALTFASLSMGIAVMTMPMGDPCDMRDPEDRGDDDDERDDDQGSDAPHGCCEPTKRNNHDQKESWPTST